MLRCVEYWHAVAPLHFRIAARECPGPQCRCEGTWCEQSCRQGRVPSTGASPDHRGPVFPPRHWTSPQSWTLFSWPSWVKFLFDPLWVLLWNKGDKMEYSKGFCLWISWWSAFSLQFSCRKIKIIKELRLHISGKVPNGFHLTPLFEPVWVLCRKSIAPLTSPQWLAPALSCSRSSVSWGRTTVLSGDPRVVSGWVKLNLVDKCFMSSDRANSSGKPPACRCASTCEGHVNYVAYADDFKTKEHASGNCISISISFYFHLFPVGTLEFPTARLQKFIEKTGTTQSHGLHGSISNPLWMNLNGFSCFIHASPKVVCIHFEPVRYTAHHGPCSRQRICRTFCR